MLSETRNVWIVVPAFNEAGVIGDVITEIDGVPSATVGLADLAELTRRPDGTVIHLRVQRDGAERVIALTLRELVP